MILQNEGVVVKVNFARMRQTTDRSGHVFERMVMHADGDAVVWYWLRNGVFMYLVDSPIIEAAFDAANRRPNGR